MSHRPHRLSANTPMTKCMHNPDREPLFDMNDVFQALKLPIKNNRNRWLINNNFPEGFKVSGRRYWRASTVRAYIRDVSL